MKLNELIEKIKKVQDEYDKKFDTKSNSQILLLKLQEELGELTQAYLRYKKISRDRGTSDQELRKNFEDEISDLFANLLMFASTENVELLVALDRKWFKYLEKK